MLAKNFAERPSAAEVGSSLSKLRAARQTPAYLRLPIDDGNGVPLPVYEETAVTPVTTLLRPKVWSDSDD